MATSSCPKCGQHNFELKEAARIKGANFKFNFIQCAGCGAVVSVVDHTHLPSDIRMVGNQLMAKLDHLLSRLR